MRGLGGALSLVLLAMPASAMAVSGWVFVDHNGDGIAQVGEAGLRGVVLSDGTQLVRSDADGRFELEAPADAVVFVVQPAGYAVPIGPDGLPAFWRSASAQGEWDIALRPAASTLPHDVRLFGDPQPKNAADVGYYAHDIVADEQALPRARLGLSLGDIVHGNVSLYPAMIRATAAMHTPWLHVSGNHDRDHTAATDEASLATFRQYFGPDTFAWQEPGLTVVVLDNVIHEPGSGVPARYVGGLRASQFAFLETYLPLVPRDHLLAVAMHMPLFDDDSGRGLFRFRPDDRQRLYRLLARHPHVLLLTSHSHEQQHRWHGTADGWLGEKPLHEYNVGAACGAFWTGMKDARGIPDTRMSDGTPNGFATLTVRAGGDYALRWHAAGLASDPGFALSAPRVLRRGAWPGFGLYANVWMGDADSRVEYRIGDGDWQPMQRVLRADPDLMAINADDDRSATLRGYDRAPEAAVSVHLWRAALPTDLAVGEHRAEVRVFDRWRGELRQSVTYRLEDASP